VSKQESKIRLEKIMNNEYRKYIAYQKAFPSDKFPGFYPTSMRLATRSLRKSIYCHIGVMLVKHGE